MMSKFADITPDTSISSVDMKNIRYEELISDYHLIGIDCGNILTNRNNSIRIKRKRSFFGKDKIGPIHMSVLKCDELVCEMINDLIVKNCISQITPATEV